MSVTTLTFDQLVKSEHNVRTNPDDSEATGALEESILATGLWLPLIVHPLPDGAFGVLDGGRRLRAIGNLIAAGRLPLDWPIECVVRDLDPAEITEASLGAYLLARELRPYEVNAAIARAAEQGADVEEIARNLGQREIWVRQNLRLGRLAPEIFDAYAKGQIGLDQARAYAATEDRDLQIVAFRHFAAGPAYNHHAHAIRTFLKVGDCEEARLLAFVGEVIYRAEGGHFELDLFADDASQRGRVTDPAKLRKLADNKLADLRQRIRLQCGRSDLKFQPDPPKSVGGYTDYSLQIEPTTRTVKGEERLILPAGEVVCSIAIAQDGSDDPQFWWASKKAKAAAERDSAPAKAGAREPDEASHAQIRDDAGFRPSENHHAAQQARAAVKDEHGLTADGLQIMRSLRRELLRALLIGNAAGDGALARDYLTWAQLRAEIRTLRSTDTGARGLASVWTSTTDVPSADVVLPFLQASEAGRIWAEALDAMARAVFVTEEDAGVALRAYIASPPQVKCMAEAVLAGLALMRSANVAGWRIPAHDVLAEIAGGDDATLRQFWRPDERFMALFPKLKRLELAQPHIDPDEFRSLHKRGDAGIAEATAYALGAAQDWVHPLLTFGVEAAAADSVPVSAPARPEPAEDPRPAPGKRARGSARAARRYARASVQREAAE